MKTRFKGHELLKGDIVDIDGVLFIVKESITTQSTGHMTRITGIHIPYRGWIKQLLDKLHLIGSNYWYETIILYHNNIYKVVGSGIEDVS